MGKYLAICLVLLTAIACNKIEDDTKVIEKDNTPRITGIGGIFFKSDNPKELVKWYAENLNLKTDDFGAVFEFRNGEDSNEINYLRWSVFDDSSKNFEPSEKDFMINYRVNNIEELVRRLKANGVRVLDSIETYDYGKFVHIMDIDGNKIELWEPVDSILTGYGGVTNK